MGNPEANDTRERRPRFDAAYVDKLEMVRPSLNHVPVPPVPADYQVRVLSAGEEPPYRSLFQLAYDEVGRIEEMRSKVLPQGFYVVEHLASRQLVASCLAYYGRGSQRHPDAGQLAWLVVDPAHGGRRLGTIVAATVTNRLAQEGFTRPFLRTEDFRIPAVAIYLQLGWQPDFYTAEMKGRWERIFVRVGRSG